jgi:biopolymer transport protein ExbD
MRLRVPLWVAIGVALILLGKGGQAAIDHWMSTRIARPVDMTVSLAAGHIRTGPFQLNLYANYWLYLTPNTNDQWDSAHPECQPYGHLQTRWVLYENGKAVDRLDEPTVLPWPSGFSAGPGMYELDVEVISDFSCLDSIPPSLEVVANTENYQTAVLFVRATLSIGTYIGLVMLTFVPVIRFVNSFERRETVTDSASIGQDFRWAGKLPLRHPISGLPSFGLVGGIVFALTAAAMMMLSAVDTYPSRGLWVNLLKMGATPKKSDAFTQPLVVLTQDAGPGQRPNLFVNSKQVAWEDFDRKLKEELGRRPNWVVYMGGDNNVPWQYVASLLDTAHGDHATVYLITGPTNR